MGNFNKDYIFKVCRVHNKKDLDNVISNNANMIGIHAVILNRAEYIENEKKYSPIFLNDDYDKGLPILSLEVDGIKNMIKYIPSNIIPVILFQREMEYKKIIECCKIYNLNIKNMYIQLQHRITENYIQNIKKEVCKNIIAVIGAYQTDFKEYFKFLERKLDKNMDYILIDMSVHQSNLSNYSTKVDKLEVIENLSRIVENNKIPIILAEDTSTENMKKYMDIISKYDINIKGLDMQNSVEKDKINQKYELYKDYDGEYQIKVRKSEKLLRNWKNFFQDNKKYFI